MVKIIIIALLLVVGCEITPDCQDWKDSLKPYEDCIASESCILGVADIKIYRRHQESVAKVCGEEL